MITLKTMGVSYDGDQVRITCQTADGRKVSLFEHSAILPFYIQVTQADFTRLANQSEPEGPDGDDDAVPADQEAADPDAE